MTFHCGMCGRKCQQDGTHLDPMTGAPVAACKTPVQVVADEAPAPAPNSPPDDGERQWGVPAEVLARMRAGGY